MLKTTGVFLSGYQKFSLVVYIRDKNSLNLRCPKFTKSLSPWDLDPHNEKFPVEKFKNQKIPRYLELKPKN